ncbi:MAG: hypothetical protein AAFY50_17310 [Cyanobacteria bacterium J06648_1]
MSLIVSEIGEQMRSAHTVQQQFVQVDNKPRQAIITAVQLRRSPTVLLQ